MTFKFDLAKALSGGLLVKSKPDGSAMEKVLGLKPAQGPSSNLDN